MACRSIPASLRRYNDGSTYNGITNSVTVTYVNPNVGVYGFVAYGGSALSQSVNKISVRISHSAGKPLVLSAITPQIMVGHQLRSGNHAKAAWVDHSLVEKISIKVSHSAGSLLRIDETRLETSIRNEQLGRYEAKVDEGCGERLAIRITHANGTLCQVDSIRLHANMRHRRQPASPS